VDAERVTANLKNGILTVTLPRAAEQKPRQIAITTTH
jgi:HSP20 family protein